MIEYKEDKILNGFENQPEDKVEGLSEMDIEVVNKGNDWIEFDVTNSHPSIVNGIRRALMTEVETIAFHSISIYENTSVYPDEFLAHRIGLIPIKLLSPSLSSVLNLPTEETSKKEKIKEIESLKFILNVENNSGTTNGSSKDSDIITVYSDSIIGDQSKVYIKPGVIICKLAPKNVISMELKISIGTGKSHTKWSPVSHCSFRLMPHIEILEDFNIEIIKDSEESATLINEIKGLFSPGVIDVVEGKMKIVNPRLEMMNREHLRHDRYKNSFRLSRDPSRYIFTFETIIEDPLIILERGLVALKNKANKLERALNNIKLSDEE